MDTIPIPIMVTVAITHLQESFIILILHITIEAMQLRIIMVDGLVDGGKAKEKG